VSDFVFTAVKTEVEVFTAVTSCNVAVGCQLSEDLAASIFMVVLSCDAV